MPQDLQPLVPAHARMTVPGHACGTATDDGVPDTYHVDADLSAQGVPGLEATPGFDGSWLFRDTVSAIYTADPGSTSGNPDPSNRAALLALAGRSLADYASWRSVAYDRNYAGVVAPEPTGLDDLVAFTYREGDVSTRLVAAPANGEPEQFNHMDPADCPPGVGLYATSPKAAVSSGRLVLTRVKVYESRGRLRSKPDGTDSVLVCP